MRIAMIGSRGIGSNYGGIERMLDELCPRLADLGHKIDVYSRPNSEFAGYDGIRAIPTRSLGGKHLDNLSRSVFALARSFGRYDIVHFHAVGPGILSSITRLGGQRSVVTVHGLDHRRDKWGGFARLCLGLAERTLIASADHTSVVSDVLRRYFIERYGIRTSFIPNGIPAKQYVPGGELLAKHDLEPRQYILFASRLTPEKGCHDLIAAFNRLVQTAKGDNGIKLVIAGGTGAPDYLEALHAQADPARVCFVGHLAGKDLAEIFSNAYAFVLPSYIEGMSMALLEAMAYRLPVVVSDIPENRAVVGDHGAYFVARDVDDLLRSLVQLTEAPAFAAEQASRLGAAEHPGWEAVALHYETLYRSVARSTPKAVPTLSETTT
jgi:glycosyltransferase involved in cell wall biosynthesis